jgi:Spy/CpxP family protein refolding chaperone
MEGAQSTGKRRALVIAALALPCVAILWMAAPKSESSSNLGSNWQCSKTAFVLTTCAPVR